MIGFDDEERHALERELRAMIDPDAFDSLLVPDVLERRAIAEERAAKIARHVADRVYDIIRDGVKEAEAESARFEAQFEDLIDAKRDLGKALLEAQHDAEELLRNVNSAIERNS